ncbi:MAG: hypothetical protein SH819_11290 [Cytophagales bacterium]|nr:hypothetical protein [Cytophagales bacterium]
MSLTRNGQPSYYSFFGLDSTKRWSGVHNKVFRVDPSTGKSSRLTNIPDMGRLASAASAVRNKAYIVGGYAVFENGKEKSSNRLFIFDSQTEAFSQGAPLPIPIDDHVQGVWNDQRLYVVGGWSDSLIVNAVQIYEPEADRWVLGTPLPNEPGAKVFGGCGLIAGDTIYFIGGATFAKNYPPSRAFYKGTIDRRDPVRIAWTRAGDFPGEFRYRSAAFFRDGRLYVVGGSNETYNYNGISYSDKKPVEPNKTLLCYDPRTGQFTTKPAVSRIMDLRGVVIDGRGNILTLGGMTKEQRVSGDVIHAWPASKGPR